MPALIMVLDKIVAPILKQKIEPKLSARQYRGKGKRSTVMAKIRLLYNAKTQNMNRAILIDLRKAFDYADRDKIRENIQRYLTPDEAILPNLILDVYQMIDVTIAEQIIKPTRGVPQGSVFGSLFFILMINDVLVATTTKYQNIRMTAYIDDIIMQGNSKEVYFHTLIRNKHLELNVDKTEYLTESNTEIIIDTITATQLKRTSTAKYLGQIIDSTCCNAQQITQKIIGNVPRVQK